MALPPPKTRSLPLNPADIGKIRQLFRWARSFKIEGPYVKMSNTPDGFIAHIEPGPSAIPSVVKKAPQDIKWGRVYSAWSAGSNNIVLTPFSGPLVATAAATGAANVNCYIHFPLDLPAIGFGASVGDLIGYIALPGVFNPSTGAQLYMLWQPPIIPRPTDAFQVYQNASSGGGSNMTMDWVKAHG